jgi:hypothetical protein
VLANGAAALDSTCSTRRRCKSATSMCMGAVCNKTRADSRTTGKGKNEIEIRGRVVPCLEFDYVEE